MKFFKTNMEKELLIAKIKRYPSLLNIFRKKKDMTEEVEDDIQIRTYGEIENFVTIFITGQQGTFKSSLGIQVAKENDPTNFNANRICFTYNELKDKIEQSRPRQWFMLDEQVFIHGIGAGRIVESIQTLIETLRQRQNSIIVISPEKKYFPEEIFTYTLETIDRSIKGVCKKDQTPHEIRTCKEKPHIIREAHLRTAVKKDKEYIGFFQKEISWGTKVWEEYQKRKTIFLKRVLTEDFQKLNYEEIADRLLAKTELKIYQTKKQLKLYLEKNIPNLSVGEKDLICEQIAIKRKQQETE